MENPEINDRCKKNQNTVPGVPIDYVKQVLSCTSNVPCVYGFVLGEAKDLRETMSLSSDIPDNHLIIKYGYTNNLVRRIREHEKTLKDLNIGLELMNYTHIKRQYQMIANKYTGYSDNLIQCIKELENELEKRN